jgi:DNA-binding transcriptional ArsR family regulator
MPSRVVVAKELSEIFKMLSHPDRIRLVEELRGGEQDVNTLHERLELPSTRVSQHLSLLRAHRIVEERREGRHVFYRLTQPELADWIIDGLRFVEGRMTSDAVQRKALNRARKLWTVEQQGRS